jgi:hypothetical protein
MGWLLFAHTHYVFKAALVAGYAYWARRDILLAALFPFSVAGLLKAYSSARKPQGRFWQHVYFKSNDYLTQNIKSNN